MAHTQTSLVGIILEPEIMSVSRLHNIPKTMILKKQPRLSAQHVSRTAINATDRSFKFKQLHLDVTGVVLQSSDHTL